MSDVIVLENVRKTYRRGSETIAAVDEVTLSVPAGEFLAIVGPSGSGKTTLLNLIGCIDRPDAGRVVIDGADTGRLPERALTKIRGQKIGFIFQQFFLLPTLTVRENVGLPAVFGENGYQAAHVDALLDRVGLAGRADHLPSQLSGGEMQRVAIARALLNNPKLIIADEPTGNLDSRNAHGILDIFRQLHRGGLTVVMVTHNQQLASEAGRIVTMLDGHVVSVMETAAPVQ
jgi:putative ABC transport system ATP-binding protein